MKLRRLATWAFCGLFFAATCAAAFFAFKIHERNVRVDQLIASVDRPEDMDDGEFVAALARRIDELVGQNLSKSELDWYPRMESTSFFNMSTEVALRYGGFAGREYGSSGTKSRVLLNALWRMGIPARKLQIGNKTPGRAGHTLVEFYYNGAWRVVSVSDQGFVWRTQDGKIAGVTDILEDEAIFAQIYAVRSGFPYRFEGYNYINWSKLPEAVVGVLKRILSEEQFAAAETPRLYDSPRNLFLLISVGLLGVSLYPLFLLTAPRR